jgi:hypothetical protein
MSEEADRETPAERALRRIRSRGRKGDDAGSIPPTSAASQTTSALHHTRAFSSVREQSPVYDDTDSPRMANSLGIATQIVERRGVLRDSLLTLGNPSGTTQRQRIVRISLTPWCHVDIEARRLARLSETDPELLGNALANALREERLRKGD